VGILRSLMHGAGREEKLNLGGGSGAESACLVGISGI